MKTILVPTDFSNAARNAAEYAMHLANEIKARVVLFHAYHLPLPSPDVPVMPISPAELQEINEEQLRIEVSRIAKKTGANVTGTAKMGFAVDEILCEEKDAVMLVMGMKGSGMLEEALIGSVTTAVLQKTRKPVLVIPENARYRDPENIVYACDYASCTNIRVLDALKCFVKTYGPKIHIVNVKPENDTPVHSQSAGLECGAGGSMQKFYSLENNDIVEGINEFIETCHADMVVMIPHRHKLLDRLFHKSVSRKMAFHTNVPLLALPDLKKPEAVLSF